MAHYLTGHPRAHSTVATIIVAPDLLKMHQKAMWAWSCQTDDVAYPKPSTASARRVSQCPSLERCQLGKEKRLYNMYYDVEGAKQQLT